MPVEAFLIRTLLSVTEQTKTSVQRRVPPVPKPPSLVPPKPPVPKAEPVKKPSGPKEEKGPAEAKKPQSQSQSPSRPPAKKAAPDVKSKKKKKKKGEELKPSVADMFATDDDTMKRLQELEKATAVPTAFVEPPPAPTKEPSIPQELKGLS